MKKKRNIILCMILTFVSILYTILIKVVDIKAIGPKNSKVGFSTLNNYYKNIVGSNMTIYKITEIFGIIVFVICLFYAIVGLNQLIKRKSLKKIDKEIYLMGSFYVLVLLFYIIFDKLAINYRPILIDGVLEPSYPSSHTVLAICVCTSSFIMANKYISKKYLDIVNISTFILMLIVLIGRLISGVHWLTDIIGGIIISLTLIMYFITIHNCIKKSNKID